MNVKKLLAILLALALALCLLPAAALADPGDGAGDTEPAESGDPAPGEAEEEPEEPEEPEDPEEPGEPVPFPETETAPEPEEEEEKAPLIVGEDEKAYPMEGDTVYNNGGTVYSNGALVYNNGGLVYQNGGTVYNNGGTVYANGGTVYNNGGTVYRNEAMVYTFADDVTDSHIYGYSKLLFAADYSALAAFEGLTEEGLLAQGEELTIRPAAGLELYAAETDSGLFTANEDGSWTLSHVEEDTELLLCFRAQAPVLELEPGTYAEGQVLCISGPAGAEIFYTTDGSEPREDNSLLYEEPLELTEGFSLSAVALLPGAEPSLPVSADYAVVSITAPEFEELREGDAQPKAQAFTVENLGTVDARILSLELEGKDAACFQLNTEKGAAVKAGQTDGKTWTLRPAKDLKAGRYFATAVFTLEGGQTLELALYIKVK